MKKSMKIIKILIILLFILIVLIIGYLLINKYSKKYKELSVEEFKKIASEEGYYVLDKYYYEKSDEFDYEPIKGVNDFAVGFHTDKDGGLDYKIYFYKYENQNDLEEYYNFCIEHLKKWNDEEKTINEETGRKL